MENRVTHFEVQADDIKRAQDFYQNVFGWKIEKWMDADDHGGMDYWGLITGTEVPGIDGGLYKRTADKKIYTYDCTISVANIDEAIDKVKQNGGMIREGKMELKGVGWFAGCTDTEGNMFSLMQSTMDPMKPIDKMKIKKI